MSTSIPGYTYGAAALARSPLPHEDLALLERTVLFTDDDRSALRQADAVLSDPVEDVLDVWYGFVGSSAHIPRLLRRWRMNEVPALQDNLLLARSISEESVSNSATSKLPGCGSQNYPGAPRM